VEATDLIVVLWDVVDQVGFGFVEVVLSALWHDWGPASIPVTRS